MVTPLLTQKYSQQSMMYIIYICNDFGDMTVKQKAYVASVADVRIPWRTVILIFYGFNLLCVEMVVIKYYRTSEVCCVY